MHFFFERAEGSAFLFRECEIQREVAKEQNRVLPHAEVAITSNTRHSRIPELASKAIQVPPLVVKIVPSSIVCFVAPTFESFHGFERFDDSKQI